MNWRVSSYDELPSTNDEMLRRIRTADAQVGDVIVAAVQSAGRGRQGRVWVSERGGLWLTAALPMGGGPAGQMALVAAVAACEAARRWAPQAGVKWPNDLLLNGRKLGGILVEWPVGAECAAVGIGINVLRAAPGSRLQAPGLGLGNIGPVAALCEGEDPRVTPEQVLPVLLDALAERWSEWCRGDWGRVRERWSALDLCLGRSVRVEPGQVVGTAEGITDAGGLRVRREDGSVLIATAGEVVFT
jgi:BirA family biotin operon repressor/biotin-[acetyl-CoA-carboxylase] ligase